MSHSPGSAQSWAYHLLEQYCDSTNQFPYGKGTNSPRAKTELVTLIVLGIMALVAALAVITYGIVSNQITIKNLTEIVEEIAEDAGLNFKDLQRFLNSLAEMVLDHWLTLDFLLAKQGGVLCYG